MGRNWFHRWFIRPEWEDAIEECKTPEDVCSLVRRWVSYRIDTIVPGSASVILHRGWGDCDDYALVIRDLCRAIGCDAWARVYYSTMPVHFGHAVAFGKLASGKMWMSSNGDYREVESEEDIRKVVARILSCRLNTMYDRELTTANGK